VLTRPQEYPKTEFKLLKRLEEILEHIESGQSHLLETESDNIFSRTEIRSAFQELMHPHILFSTSAIHLSPNQVSHCAKGYPALLFLELGSRRRSRMEDPSEGSGLYRVERI
jgi:hypothetical protein